MIRVRFVKGILWFLVGLAAAVTIFRFLKGLGTVTALTDTTPWGLWIGFDVLGGVALAAGGFVIAATVYIFHLKKYEPILRPAVLTACLGYAAVVGGLMFDIGIPWNIWRPMFFWQEHSALFEVAWCVMLYFTVLQLEFLPVILEKFKHPLSQTAYKILKFFTLPLVILGIMLSTLHQSSLGTLFLIMPHRLHPLWYSPIIPLHFFVSAIGLGLTMVITESLVSSWIYKKHLEKDLLSGLAKAAAIVLWAYAAIKVADLAATGKLHYLFAGTWESNLFLFELLISAILPAALFSSAKARQSTGGLAAGAGLAVFGFVLNRIAVSGLATISATQTDYFPSWTEFAISIGIVSAAGLAFFFLVENFYVYDEPRAEKRDKYEIVSPDPVGGIRLHWSSLADARLYSLLFVVALALGIALMPNIVTGVTPERIEVEKARRVDAFRSKSDASPLYLYALYNPDEHDNPEAGEVAEMLLIDGDRNNKFVLFDHGTHEKNNGGPESCGMCHHMNKPLDKATSCYECHTDMFLTTDTFQHEYHREKLKEQGGCVKCHKDPAEPKTRETATACGECHKNMRVPNSFVKVEEADQTGIAPGYMNVMHKLCIECHKQKQEEKVELAPDLARCAACHQGLDESMLMVVEPYPQPQSMSLLTQR
ncbi:MAG: Ni/Fe-hydrogenase cytochrome b subunit [Candidatus Abyssobacteria bacterium SURF_5]|uniref:Ni/Fe-hydrogenase cytochrome b subunit n=1 Tax=Abyssobacteria bacterium (strain SURF_5) TaxID=2093360 RepID=A0A3A4NVE4_ABYX5|nr:MAG: Ni/Fe-hydrogenase cytochrome b subunit [Candidatus Abyssubacteria bacterium SURF_5]